MKARPGRAGVFTKMYTRTSRTHAKARASAPAERICITHRGPTLQFLQAPSTDSVSFSAKRDDDDDKQPHRVWAKRSRHSGLVPWYALVRALERAQRNGRERGAQRFDAEASSGHWQAQQLVRLLTCLVPSLSPWNAVVTGKRGERGAACSQIPPPSLPPPLSALTGSPGDVLTRTESAPPRDATVPVTSG